MKGPRHTRRAEAEIDASAAQTGCAGIGGRSIHQFWHLFAAHFRGILLAPRRRPDSGKVAWGWRESGDSRPLTAIELAEVRRRLAAASRSLAGLLPGQTADDEQSDDGDDKSIEAQVRARVGKMAADFIAKSDATLAGFVCRDEAGLMLHSWGAANPAKPSYPDTAQGEIDGRVMVDGNGAEGLSVVLENLAGLGVARTKSERTGVFHFQGIAPGKYCLRVANRTDFPPEGLPVTLERTALTGLELRARPAAAAPVVPDNQPAGVPTSGRRGRGWLALLGLALLVGGAVWWHHGQQKPAPPAEAARDMSWRSAQGELAAATDSAGRTEGGTVGTGGGWSELSRTIAGPKPATTRPHLPSNGMARGPASSSVDETGVPTDAPQHPGMRRGSDSPPAANPAGPGLTQSATPSPMMPPAAKVELDRPTRDNEATGPTSAAVVPAEAEPTAQVAGDSVASGPRNSFAQSRSLNSTDPVDEREALAPAATLHAAPIAPLVARKGEGLSSGGDSISSRNGSGGASAVPAANASAISGAASSPNSAAGGPSAGRIAARPGPVRRERNGATVGYGTTVMSADVSGPADVAAKATAADKISEHAKEAGEGEVQVRAPKGGAAADPVGRAVAAAKRGGSDDDSVVPAVPSKADERQPPAASGVPPTGSVAAPAADDDRGRLILQGRISSSIWRTVPVQDMILPTLPMAADSKEAPANLREKFWRDQRSKLPRTLRDPVIQCGFAVEFPARPDQGLRPPRWRDEQGGAPAEATVTGRRAELAWTGRGPDKGKTYVLAWPDGREIARISVDAAGAPVLAAARNVPSWYWVGIALDAADLAENPAASRFSWRTLAGGTNSMAWRRDDGWRAGRGRRVELPLTSEGKSAAGHSLAFADEISGWAVSCDFTAQ